MMRRTQVFELINHAEGDLENIEKYYDESLKNKNIPISLQIDIKNMMENLRSALDYMAHDIYEKNIEPHRRSTGKKQLDKIYFPYGKDGNSFKSMLGNNLPKLETLNNNVYSIIEAIQPHKTGDMWLYHLCTLVNQNKHNSITPQTRTETKTFEAGIRGKGPAISAPAGSIEAPPGAIMIGNNPLIFDPSTGIPIPTGNLDVKVTVWVSFLFSGTQLNVLPFLNKSLSEIKKLSTQLYKVI